MQGKQSDVPASDKPTINVLDALDRLKAGLPMGLNAQVIALRAKRSAQASGSSGAPSHDVGSEADDSASAVELKNGETVGSSSSKVNKDEQLGPKAPLAETVGSTSSRSQGLIRNKDEQPSGTARAEKEALTNMEARGKSRIENEASNGRRARVHKAASSSTTMDKSLTRPDASTSQKRASASTPSGSEASSSKKIKMDTGIAPDLTPRGRKRSAQVSAERNGKAAKGLQNQKIYMELSDDDD